MDKQTFSRVKFCRATSTVQKFNGLFLVAILACACAEVIPQAAETSPTKSAAVAGPERAAESPAGSLTPAIGTTDLADVRSWAIQLTGYERPGAMEELCRAKVDMLVIDPVVTVTGQEDFAIQDFLDEFQSCPGPSGGRRLCLGYINVGEAESYRTYWSPGWRAPAKNRPGNPRFLISEDQDGWAENFTVRFWDRDWQQILFGRPGSMVDQLLESGFDGVFLDWVAAWSDETVMREAEQSGVDPAVEMAKLLRAIAKYARKRVPDFRLVANNGAGLLQAHPELKEVLDGVVQESLSYRGSASSDWNDPENADFGQDQDSVHWAMSGLTTACMNGVIVFTIDYASKRENIEAATRFARAQGFVPCVTRTPLCRLPDYVVSR